MSRRNSPRKTPLYHCNACKGDFTVKVGTVMEASNIPLSKWAMAFYLMSTNLKGVSSVKLHRDLGITQKSAWFMEHRIRETWNDKTTARFVGPVEADESYFGGKEGNKHEDKKLHTGRHNARPMDTIDQMAGMAAGAAGKRLRYAELIGPESTRSPRML